MIDGSLIHHESRRENFRRTFGIDPSIGAHKIKAKIEQGLLTVTLPKAEHVKPRKITCFVRVDIFQPKGCGGNSATALIVSAWRISRGRLS